MLGNMHLGSIAACHMSVSLWGALVYVCLRSRARLLSLKVAERAMGRIGVVGWQHSCQI